VDSRKGHATQEARGFVYRESFEKEGWRIAFVDCARAGEDAIVAEARAYSRIYLLKVGSFSLVKKLRDGVSAPLIFDLTDTLWKPVHRRGGWQDLERILRTVDAVFCENAYVAAYGRRFNPRLFQVPACSQVELFDAARSARRPRADAGVVIGWVGSPGTTPALGKVRRPLERLLARHPGARFRIVGGDAVSAARILERVPYTLRADYDGGAMIQEMLSMDIGIFPAPFDAEDYRARGPLKALLYMAAGIPAVCQAGGECSEIVEDGVTGMLARSEKEWEEKLEALIGSAELRRRMGRAALEKVRRDHSLEASFRTLRETLESLRASREAGPSLWVRFADALRSGCIRAGVLAYRLRRRLA
jgi:glycosyltransferase involved in cell wall biosynthesis